MSSGIVAESLGRSLARLALPESDLGCFADIFDCIGSVRVFDEGRTAGNGIPCRVTANTIFTRMHVFFCQAAALKLADHLSVTSSTEVLIGRMVDVLTEKPNGSIRKNKLRATGVTRTESMGNVPVVFGCTGWPQNFG